MSYEPRTFRSAMIKHQAEEIEALRTQLAELEGIRDQFNWQSEQDAEALRERDEEIAEQGERLKVAEGLLNMIINQAASHQLSGRERVVAFLSPTPPGAEAAGKEKDDGKEVD